MAPRQPPISELIHWHFTISEQGFTARYGVLAGLHYKQILPFGKVNDLRFPPKSIDEKTYNLAKSIGRPPMADIT